MLIIIIRPADNSIQTAMGPWSHPIQPSTKGSSSSSSSTAPLLHHYHFPFRQNVSLLSVSVSLSSIFAPLPNFRALPRTLSALSLRFHIVFVQKSVFIFPTIVIFRSNLCQLSKNYKISKEFILSFEI